MDNDEWSKDLITKTDKQLTGVLAVDLELRRAIKERDKYLKNNPELYPFQASLDRYYEHFGNTPESNMKVIQKYMEKNLKRLQLIQRKLGERNIRDTK